MKYEIVNPSDKCFITSDEPFAAVVACALIGGGWYGLKDENNNVVISPLATIESAFHITAEETAKKISEYKVKIYECLRSFEYGEEPTSCNDIGANAKAHADRLEILLKEEGLI